MTNDDLSLAEIHSLIKKHGGVEEVKRFLRGETHVVDVNSTFILDMDRYPDPQFVGGALETKLDVIQHDQEGLMAFTIENMLLDNMQTETRWESIDLETARLRIGEISARLYRHLRERVHYPNVILRDFLLQHQHLIPDEWARPRHAHILFLGTLLMNPKNDQLLVPSMQHNGHGWRPSTKAFNSDMLPCDQVLCHKKADSFIIDGGGRLVVHLSSGRR